MVKKSSRQSRKRPGSHKKHVNLYVNAGKTIQEHVNDLISPILMQNIQRLMLAADSLHFEIGGYLDTTNFKLVPTVRAESDYIHSMAAYNYPIVDRISFHTHPSFLKAQFDEGGSVPICLPSHTDLVSLLNSSISYKKTFPELLFSKNGIVIYQVNLNLLKAIMTFNKEEQTEIINDFILPNIGYANWRLLQLNDNLAIAQFIKEIGKVFMWRDRKTKEERFAGFDVFYIPFPIKAISQFIKEIGEGFSWRDRIPLPIKAMVDKLINLPIA
jgi:hypothetical protein